ARAAGDLVDNGIDPVNAFWFSQHVAAQMAYGRLRGTTVFPYDGNIEAVTAEAVRFVLSGIGLKREAIETSYDPSRMTAMCQAGQLGATPAGPAAPAFGPAVQDQ